MTSLYSQLDFDEDELERELELELEAELEETVEPSIDRYEFDDSVERGKFTMEEYCRKRKRNCPPSYSQITEDTVCRLIDYWVIDMCFITEAARAKSGKFPGKRRKVVPKLTQEHCKFMEDYLDNKPLSTLREVNKELHDKFLAVHISLSTVYNYVTNISDNKA
ncbi:hypothetical protein BGZ49_009818 [Haplosporangium sp. Z 27]|nr:hypothetical protein BGZ49_009818 [Haplosporangium sp. Z 27]